MSSPSKQSSTDFCCQIKILVTHEIMYLSLPRLLEKKQKRKQKSSPQGSSVSPHCGEGSQNPRKIYIILAGHSSCSYPTSWYHPGPSHRPCLCLIGDLKRWAEILPQHSRYNKILTTVRQSCHARCPSNSQQRPKHLNEYHKPWTQIPSPCFPLNPRKAALESTTAYPGGPLWPR